MSTFLAREKGFDLWFVVILQQTSLVSAHDQTREMLKQIAFLVYKDSESIIDRQTDETTFLSIHGHKELQLTKKLVKSSGSS